LYSRSGDRELDLALALSLTRLSDLFGVRPGFLYYDDYDGKNARASPEKYTDYGPDGTVLFGTRLLADVMSGMDNPDASVACICAHEFGHILQYKGNMDMRLKQGQATVKRAELQADFFAGYFAGTRKKENPAFAAAVFAVTQYTYGDDEVNNQNHHGTPNERSAAIVRGFDAAYRENLSLPEAIGLSLSYVTSL
jgi:hypothetical protein